MIEQPKIYWSHMILLASQPLEIFKWLYEHRKSDEYVFINRTNLAKPMPVETPLAAIKRAGLAGLAFGENVSLV